jgi:beta-galactosidase
MSEYGAGANINQHEENPKQPVPTSQWHPEEWQSIVHEQLWPQFKSRPFVWATFAWNLADFTSYWRNEGGVPGRNDKGLVTANRKVRKDAFYFYKANWSTEPVLYITSRRFTARTNKTTDIKVYSNAKEVELFVNGVSQGRRADGINGVFNWPNIHLQPGDNLVEVRGEKDGQTLKDNSLLTLNSSPVKSTVAAKNQNTTVDIQ